MNLIDNTGTNRVIDVLRQAADKDASLDIATPTLSLFAFFEVRDLLNRASRSRLVLPLETGADLTLLGSVADRAARNGLQARWLAQEFAKWINTKAEVRSSSSPLPQSAYVIEHPEPARSCVITGNCPLTTDGLGLAPSNQFSLIPCAETDDEVKLFSAWYESLWSALPASCAAKDQLLARLGPIADHVPAALIYYRIRSSRQSGVGF